MINPCRRGAQSFILLATQAMLPRSHSRGHELCLQLKNRHQGRFVQKKAELQRSTQLASEQHSSCSSQAARSQTPQEQLKCRKLQLRR